MTAASWANVPLGPPDAIFGLLDAFKADPAPGKVNLTVGAYRDEEGKPWVLPSVRKAEELVVAASMNKEYAPIGGIEEYVKLAREFALGAASPALQEQRVTSLQCLSGTGSLRLIANFYAKFIGKGTPLYLPSPSWGNHSNIFREAGLEVRSYRYWDPKKLGLDLDGMLADLAAAPPGSVVLLHACAHNPTGVDPTPEQWRRICTEMRGSALHVLFDSAYQGFASGDAEADAFAMRLFIEEGVPFALAQSFAKNFGLYGERVGLLSMVCASSSEAERVLSQLKILVRSLYSNPPIHGARIVSTVLRDPELSSQWRSECKAMADRIKAMRSSLREELAQAGSTLPWEHITNQIGMFCFTGLDEAQVAAVRDEHHVYMTKDGRISMAGLNSSNVKYVANALHAVTAGGKPPAAGPTHPGASSRKWFWW